MGNRYNEHASDEKIGQFRTSIRGVFWSQVLSPGAAFSSECGSSLLFHHIGVACTNVDSQSRILGMFGYSPEGQDFTDPIQGVEGRFLTGPGPRLELIRQLQDGGVITSWLNRRVLLYHLAFETADLSGAIERLQARRGGKVVVAPVPAVAFDGRHIAFMMLANGLLVEFIGAE